MTNPPSADEDASIWQLPTPRQPGGSQAGLARLPSGKSRNPTIARFEIDSDRHLLALQRELLDGRYCPSAWRLHSIHDPKTRLIAAPAVRDRILHHAVLHEIGPLVERRYIDQSFAAGQNRGPHRAVLYFLRCQRSYAWRLHLDSRSYFLSISHERLHALFGERIVDTDTLELLRLIIASGDHVYGSVQWPRIIYTDLSGLMCQAFEEVHLSSRIPAVSADCLYGFGPLNQ